MAFAHRASSGAAFGASSAMFDILRQAGPTRADSVKRMETVAHILDTAFLIPGTNQRIGIDAIIGVVPGIGDAITTALSSYVIWEARQLGISRFAIWRMLGNLAIHGTVGTIPVFGDIFAAFFRVNRRNLRIVLQELRRSGALDGHVLDGQVIDGQVIDGEVTGRGFASKGSPWRGSSR